MQKNGDWEFPQENACFKALPISLKRQWFTKRVKRLRRPAPYCPATCFRYHPKLCPFCETDYSLLSHVTNRRLSPASVFRADSVLCSLNKDLFPALIAYHSPVIIFRVIVPYSFLFHSSFISHHSLFILISFFVHQSSFLIFHSS